MKFVPFLFALIFTSCSFSQNEWWRIGKSNEAETEEVETTVEETPEEIIKETPKDTVTELWVNDSIKEPEEFKKGTINVSKSSAVDKIIKFKSTTIPPNLSPLMDGYRIQLFFDQDRNEVDKARSKVLQMDDETPTYIEYKAPNYFLLLGDYRTKLAAEKVRAELNAEFPTAIVVEDRIYLPKIDGEEETDEH
ncbi:SPOR domain-containing protein [Brumimicrobium aurantiacum]|uniref:SPOR domain-containing protein n=1 Tax=Brumimicrobium aurantiacum TaxID=1737063 RepID=A0A3E1EXH7_9FLAO|nr:SPOR domain-containing protein [Brumimicrobium aurantiacum]RFC54259.1 hypothetical protein DXU93_09745 [Brumimicrobium aurantiacum]